MECNMSFESWKTLNDHVLVRQDAKKEKTESGLFIAPTARETEIVVSADVLSVCETPSEDAQSIVVVAGNKILFDVRKSVLLEDMSSPDEKVRVVKLTDIIAVIE